VRTKGIFLAILTAHEIEQLARRQLAQAATKPDEVVDLEVKNPRTNTAQTLHVTFQGIRKQGLLHGRTDNGEFVLIKLGDVAERQLRRPAVILSVKEITKSVGQSVSPINATSKRR
jgi:hypothetical protein